MADIVAMHPRTLNIQASDVNLDREEILRLLGEHHGAKESFSGSQLDLCIEECRKVMNPRGAYVYVEAETSNSPEEIVAHGLQFRTGKIVHNMLKHSESYALFLVTAGTGPEQLARELLKKGEYFEGFLVDLVASALVDSVADLVHKEIRKEALGLGRMVTNRYSPGYCSWDVAEQQKLFSLFPDRCCGISLSESSLMDPVKSISGIIGTGSRVRFNEYTCEICPMQECDFRKTRNQL